MDFRRLLRSNESADGGFEAINGAQRGQLKEQNLLRQLELAAADPYPDSPVDCTLKLGFSSSDRTLHTSSSDIYAAPHQAMQNNVGGDGSSRTACSWGGGMGSSRMQWPGFPGSHAPVNRGSPTYGSPSIAAAQSSNIINNYGYIAPVQGQNCGPMMQRNNIAVAEEAHGGARRCSVCDTTSTPLWRNGPMGSKSLCNACGIRYKKEERKAMGIAPQSRQRGAAAPKDRD